MTTRTDFPRTIDAERDKPLEPCPSWCIGHPADFAEGFENRSAVEYQENRDVFRTHHCEGYDGDQAALAVRQRPRQEVYVELAVSWGTVPHIVRVELSPAEAAELGQALIESASRAQR